MEWNEIYDSLSNKWNGMRFDVLFQVCLRVYKRRIGKKTVKLLTIDH